MSNFAQVFRNSCSIKTLPFTVITGFLGSGKTTLLNHLLKHPDVEDVAVIINEFGEIGLDHLLVETASENMLLLERGCVCCTIRSDLVETLDDLMQRRESGSISQFTRVVIETTGLADPAPILHTLMTNQLMTRHFYLDSVVTTVDSTYGVQQLIEHPESVKQVAMADRLVVTKTDLVDSVDMNTLKAKLVAINPGAAILQTTGHDFEPTLIFGTGLYQPQKQQANTLSWLQAQSADNDHHKSLHSEKINTYCFIRQTPVSRAVLGLWLMELTRDYGDKLLRIKGLVNVEYNVGALVVQGVQHRIYPPVHLPEWPSIDQRTRIVFITGDFDCKIIEQHFAIISQQLSTTSCG